MYHYRLEVLEELERHGVHPKPTTPPQFVKDFVTDLYQFELRKLRDRLMRGEFPKAQYSGHIVQLRKRYLLVSLPLGLWTK